MAKKQTRKSVSLNRTVYTVLMAEAARRGVSAAVVIDSALKALGLDVPATTHQTAEEIARMRKARGYRAVSRPKEIRRYPSRERQVLGDELADMLGFR